MWNKFKSIFKDKLKWLWLPLSLGVFTNYLFSRGLILFSKTDLVPPEIGAGMPFYLVSVSLACLVLGVLLDKVNTRKLLLLFSIMAVVGLAIVKLSPIGFGLLFGAAAAMTRLGPFSGPMKLLDRKEGFNIVPQSVAKSLGGVVMTLFLASLLYAVGWIPSMAILSIIYLGVGYWIFKVMPDDYIQGWNLKAVFKIAKERKWHMLLILLVAITGASYSIFLSRMVPSLQLHGYTKALAVLIASMAGWFEVGGRFLFGWIGDKYKAYWLFLLIYCIIAPISTWVLLPVFPLLAIILHFFFGAAYTPCLWPFVKYVGGKEHVATLYGLHIVIQYSIAGLLF